MKSNDVQLGLEEVKCIQMEILDAVDLFCKAHSIRYFLTAGTLIGALRHKGYIPWDDDIDIVMMRQDYEIFIHEFNEGSNGRYIVTSHELGDDIPYAFAKVYDKTTVFIEDEGKSKRYPIGVNIDIFPLDTVPDNYSDAVKMIKKAEIYTRIVDLKNISRDKKRSFAKTALIVSLQTLAKIIPYKWCFEKIDCIAMKYKSYTNSKYVANAVIMAKGEKEIVERNWFSDQIDLEFEGKLYKGPIGADSYMERLFGNYMELPPMEKRVSHHYFRAYKKTETE